MGLDLSIQINSCDSYFNQNFGFINLIYIFMMRSNHQRIHWRFQLVQLLGLGLRSLKKLSMNFKRIFNKKEQALINLIHVQEGLRSGTKSITQGLGEED